MVSNNNRIRTIIFFFLIFLLSLSIFLIWRESKLPPRKNNHAIGSNQVIDNYSKEIYKEANRLGLNPEYFMALCMLECGGRRPSPSRFEKHIYRRLMNLKAGKRTHYEKVTIETLKDANESAIKNLASSWGPFQIMGYKVVQEGILIKDLRGPAAVKHGMKWIANEYGHLLKKDRYSDAFHYHNTGKVIGKNRRIKTHSKTYVSDGRKWMKYFKKKHDA